VTLSQAGSDSGILNVLNAILALRAMASRSFSARFQWKGRTSIQVAVFRTQGRGDLSPFF
jgi:hypothetical protein